LDDARNTAWWLPRLGVAAVLAALVLSLGGVAARDDAPSPVPDSRQSVGQHYGPDPARRLSPQINRIIRVAQRTKRNDEKSGPSGGTQLKSAPTQKKSAPPARKKAPVVKKKAPPKKKAAPPRKKAPVVKKKEPPKKVPPPKKEAPKKAPPPKKEEAPPPKKEAPPALAPKPGPSDEQNKPGLPLAPEDAGGVVSICEQNPQLQQCQDQRPEDDAPPPGPDTKREPPFPPPGDTPPLPSGPPPSDEGKAPPPSGPQIQTVTECPEGQSLFSGTCIPDECAEGEYRSTDYTCVAECPDDTTPTTAAGSGDFCQPSCPEGQLVEFTRCVDQCGPSFNYEVDGQCLQYCPEGTITFEGQCLSECPAGRYLIDEQCVAECPEGWAGSGSKCVQQCPDSTYMNGNLCVDQCPEGTAPGTGSNSGTCVPTTCPEGQVLQSESCADECAPGYNYTLGIQCIYSCPDGTAVYEGQCLESCPEGRTKFDSDCILDCADGEYYSWDDDSCKPQACQPGEYKDNAGNCVTECPEGSTPHPGFGNKPHCQQQCPEGQFAEYTRCVDECSSGYDIVVDGACYSACPDGQVQSGNQCVGDCREDQITLPSGLCAPRCSSGQGWFAGQCVDQGSCPGLVESGDDQSDLQCAQTCPEGEVALLGICVAPQDCTDQGGFVRNHRCVAPCSEGEVHTGFDTCAAQCPEGQVEFAKFCIPQGNCPEGEVQKMGGGGCVDREECLESVFAVEREGMCIGLSPCMQSGGLWTNTLQCVEQCPDGATQVGSICSLQCEAGQYESGSECVTQCPEGQFVISGKYCRANCPDTMFEENGSCLFFPSCPDGETRFEGECTANEDLTQDDVMEMCLDSLDGGDLPPDGMDNASPEEQCAVLIEEACDEGHYAGSAACDAAPPAEDGEAPAPADDEATPPAEVGEAPPPAEETPPTDEQVPPPSDDTAPPPEGDEAPPAAEDETTPPADEVTPPEEAAPPAEDDTPPPADGEAPPPAEEQAPPPDDDETPPPDETAAPPADDGGAPPPADETPPPADEAPPAPDEAPPPADDEAPPPAEDGEATPPDEGAPPPEEETTPPAEEQPPPGDEAVPPPPDDAGDYGSICEQNPQFPQCQDQDADDGAPAPPPDETAPPDDTAPPSPPSGGTPTPAPQQDTQKPAPGKAKKTTEATKPLPVAVVIAIDDYDDAKVKGAPQAISSAAHVVRFLKDDLDMDGERIVTGRNATLSDFQDIFGKPGDTKSELRDVLNDAKASEVIVYFAGRAKALDGGNDVLLLPADADPKKPDSGLRLSALYDALAGMEIPKLRLYLDASFANGEDVVTVDAGPRIGLFGLFTPSNWVTLSAASDTSKVGDTSRPRSLFTESLVAGLRGIADTTGDGDADGTVSAKELYDFTRGQAEAAVKRGDKVPMPSLYGKPSETLRTY